MGTVGVVLLVAFVIVCVLLVLLVLVQDDGSHGMGGLLGGRGSAAFGSHSASVLTKATFTLVVLFFALALSLALLNRRPAVRRDLAPAGAERTNEAKKEKWYEEDNAAESTESSIIEESEEAHSGEAAEGGTPMASGDEAQATEETESTAPETTEDDEMAEALPAAAVEEAAGNAE